MTGIGASLLVEVEGHLLAVAAGHVRRIVEPPPTVEVPFAPAAVEGLVAIDGSILPLVDLGAWLENRATAPGTRQIPGQVMVLDAAAGRLAVRVTRVVTLVEAESLGDSAAPSWNGRVVAPLAPDMIDFGDAAAITEADTPPGAVGETPEARQQPDARTEPFIVMDVGGERYALPVDAVREIVLPGEIWGMPTAPPAVLGVSYLRGAPVAVLSLAALLGRSPTSSGVLVTLDGDGGRFAVLADRVLGLQRFRSRAEHSEDYVDDDGMVVTALGPDRLIPDPVRRLFPAAVREAELSAPQPQAMRRIVTFRAAGEPCALSLDEVERAVEYRTPARVPRTGAGFAEAIEVGGAVVPVVDIRRQIAPVEPGSPPGACLVARVGNHAYALAIDRLERLAMVPAEAIEAIAGGDGPVVGVGRLDARPFWLLSAERLVTAAGAR